MGEENCESCKHWVKQAPVDDTHTIGECRLQMIGYGAFLGTMNNESCADWKQRTDDEG